MQIKFSEWLKEKDNQLYSEVNWKELLKKAALYGSIGWQSLTPGDLTGVGHLLNQPVKSQQQDASDLQQNAEILAANDKKRREEEKRKSLLRKYLKKY